MAFVSAVGPTYRYIGNEDENLLRLLPPIFILKKKNTIRLDPVSTIAVQPPSHPTVASPTFEKNALI